MPAWGEIEKRRCADFSFRVTGGGGITVEMGVKTMRPGATSKSKTAKRSFTDRILTLCASGRFGVREAIAAVTKSEHTTKEQPTRPQTPEKAEVVGLQPDLQP